MEEAPAGAEESLLEAEDIATPSATLAGSTKNAMS
jgi:hypothetical protein